MTSVEAEGDANGTLAGLRVLDLSRVLAGPWATQILGDLGAEVIKIERPGSGDETRGWGPPYALGRDGAETDQSAYFLCANRNKRSLAVDMADPVGQEVLRDMVRHCDVVVENFKVGGLARYGLDYASLSAINPRLIYCSITGFGQDGPYSGRAGYDFVVQAMCGLMSVTGPPDGEPQKVGVALTDIMTGLYATIGIVAAIAERQRSGQGQYVDLSLLDVGVATMANQALNYLTAGNAPSRMGNEHPNIVPYQVFATLDGFIVVAVGNDGQFARLCQVLNLGEVVLDPRYRSNRDRVTNRETLVPALSEVMATRTTGDWTTALEQAGVPCGPVNTLDQVFADPHVRHHEMARTLPDLVTGEVPTVASPLRLSRSPVRYDAAPPHLGQHSREILAAVLGYDGETINRLIEKGVVSE